MEDIFDTDNEGGDRIEITSEGGWVTFCIDSYERSSAIIHKYQAIAAARAILRHFNEQ